MLETTIFPSTFYLIYPLGMAQLGQKELELKISLLQINDVKIMRTDFAGIELNTSLESIVELNAHLKLCTRILLRLHQSTVRDLPKLYNKIKKMPWKSWLAANSIKLTISSSKSRLINTSKVEHTIREALACYYSANPVAKKIQEKFKTEHDVPIYVRIENDQINLSLALSQSRLDHRHDQLEKSHSAPLRRSLASAIVLFTWEYLNKLHPEHHFNVHDPFCGSATILEEAHQFFHPTARFAQVCYSPLFESIKANQIYAKRPLFNQLSGSDIKPVESNQDEIKLFQKSFFEIDALKEQTIIITNPPYQKRIKTKNELSASHIIKHAQKIGAKYIGMILPVSEWDQLKSIRYALKIAINNGGIACEYRLFKLDQALLAGNN